MKKIKRWILPVLTVLCVILFAVYCIWMEASRDETAPVIVVEGDVISLSVHDGQETLLKGVTAWDEQDGDVTELLVVEGISAIREGNHSTVTYAAFDRAGNVTKAQRTVAFTDYEGPKFEFSTALMFRSGYTVDLYDYVTASDPIDGDLSGQIRVELVEGELDLSTVGTHLVELRVTNSMGDTARLTVPVQVYSASDYNASLYLTNYLVYLEKGQYFDSGFYLSRLSAGDQILYRDMLAENGAVVDIRSDVQTDIPGTYSVTYTVSYENYIGSSRLIVVVEE